MTIELLKQDIVQGFSEKNMKECSYDDNNDFVLVDSDMSIYDFDEICEEIVEEMEDVQLPSSLDSLYVNIPDKIGFVEFKNSDWGKIKKHPLRNKIYDTIALIIAEYQLGKEDLKNVIIYLVHRADHTANPNHTWINGKCPPEYRFIQETSGVTIMRCDASTFETYLNRHNRLPYL